MNRLHAVAIVALLSVVRPVMAAEPAGTAADLARLLVPREAWDKVVQNLSQNVQSRLQGHPGASLHYPADLPAKAKAEVETTLLPYDDVIALNAKELSAAYSEAELKDLLAFYRTPTGQKNLKVTPTVANKVASESQRRVDQKMPEVMQRLAKLAQSSGATGSPAPAKGGSGK